MLNMYFYFNKKKPNSHNKKNQKTNKLKTPSIILNSNYYFKEMYLKKTN